MNPGEMRPVSRWAEWEKEVLSRVSRWDECPAIIPKRAKELDADEEDARECEEFFAAKLTEHRHNPLIQIIKIPIPIAAQWLSDYEGKPIKAGIVTRSFKQKPLKRLKWGKEEDRRYLDLDRSRGSSSARAGRTRLPFDNPPILTNQVRTRTSSHCALRWRRYAHGWRLRRQD